MKLVKARTPSRKFEANQINRKSPQLVFKTAGRGQGKSIKLTGTISPNHSHFPNRLECFFSTFNTSTHRPTSLIPPKNTICVPKQTSLYSNGSSQKNNNPFFDNNQKKRSSTLERLSVWKSGPTFVSQTQAMPRGQRTMEMEAPDALENTLSISSKSKSLYLDRMRSGTATRTEERFCLSISDLIEANLGQVVEIQVGTNWFIGRIYSFQSQEGKGLLFFETERGTLALPLSDLKAFRYPTYAPPELQIEQQATLRTRIRKTFKDQTLQFRYQYLDDKTEEYDLQLRYAMEGVNWQGHYTLNLDHHIPQLKLDITLMNRLDNLSPRLLECAFGISPFVENAYSPRLDPITTSNFPAENSLQTIEPTDESVGRSAYLFEAPQLKGKTCTTLHAFDIQVPSFEIIETEESNSPLMSLKMKNESEFHWAQAPLSLFWHNSLYSVGPITSTPKGETVSLTFPIKS